VDATQLKLSELTKLQQHRPEDEDVAADASNNVMYYTSLMNELVAGLAVTSSADGRAA
jgi:hypothetical protein